MIPLPDVGAVAAILVAADRGLARITQARAASAPPIVPLAYHGADCPGHTIGIPGTTCFNPTGETIMTDVTPEPRPADPYAGARAMGITAPPAPAVEAPAVEAPESEPAAVSAPAPVLPAAGPVQTPLSGKLRGIAADVIDVIQALEAAEE